MPQRFIETCSTELVSKYTIALLTQLVLFYLFLLIFFLEYMENENGGSGAPKRGIGEELIAIFGGRQMVRERWSIIIPIPCFN